MILFWSVHRVLIRNDSNARVGTDARATRMCPNEIMAAGTVGPPPETSGGNEHIKRVDLQRRPPDR